MKSFQMTLKAGRNGRFFSWGISAKLFLFVFLLTTQILSASAKDLPTARPESVGVASNRLERLNSLFNQYIESEKLVGAVSIVARRGKVIHFESYGALNVETQQAMSKDSLFRIYSMTKPITTVAAMMLYEQGKFQLTDPVEKYLPEFKNILVLSDKGGPVRQNQPFTIEMLMTHTAGFANGRLGSGIVDQQYHREELFEKKNLEEMVLSLSDIPLQYQPGQEWHYSVSVDVLARLIEVLSGQPFDTFLQENILAPLEMNDTFFQVPQDKLSRFGTNHQFNQDTNSLELLDRPDDSSTYVNKVTLFSGGSGLVSSAEDYLRFCLMLLNGGELDGQRLLSPKTIEHMTLNHIASSHVPNRQLLTAGSGFGLGFAVLENPEQAGTMGSAGEYYWSGGAGTLFWIDPQEQLVVVVMIQQQGIGSSLKNITRTIIYGSLFD